MSSTGLEKKNHTFDGNHFARLEISGFVDRPKAALAEKIFLIKLVIFNHKFI